mgnify:CR=1 FL=1
MKISPDTRLLEPGESSLSILSAAILGLRDLNRPTNPFRLGLLWLILDPFFTTAIYGFLIIIVRGNFTGWSILVGILTLQSLNRPISSNMTAKLTTEPFPLMHTSTRPILVSRFTAGAAQGLLYGISGSFVIFLLSDTPNSLFVQLPIVCILLSFIGVSIGLLISPVTDVFKDLEKLFTYALLLSFFLQAVLYDYHSTSGLHQEVLSYMPHTLGVEWLRSIVSGRDFPFSFTHSLQVISFWLMISIIGVSRINRARWRLTSWD